MIDQNLSRDTISYMSRTSADVSLQLARPYWLYINRLVRYVSFLHAYKPHTLLATITTSKFCLDSQLIQRQRKPIQITDKHISGQIATSYPLDATIAFMRTVGLLSPPVISARYAHPCTVLHIFSHYILQR